MPEDTAVTYMPTIRRCIAGEHTSVPQERKECDSPALAKLAQAYDGVRKLQQKLSPLDRMFFPLTLNGTTHSEEICTSVPEAQTVPHLGRYEPNNTYGTLRFDLQNAPRPYEMPIDLAKDAAYSGIPTDLLRGREQSAAAALKHIPYHYHKDAGGGPESFSTEIPDNNGARRICCPDGGRSDSRMLNEIFRFVGQFIKCLRLPPTHAACSPSTAMRIGQNTETGADPRFKEACRTYGGEFPFPGLSGQSSLNPKMVVSPACKDDILYVTSKMSRVLLKAEGPKIIRRGESGALAVTDFFQHKCAYEDLQTDSPFACVIDLQTA